MDGFRIDKYASGIVELLRNQKETEIRIRQMQ